MMLRGAGALVTGGAVGLGKGLAEGLLKVGARVCLLDVNATDGETVTKEFNAKYGSDKAMFCKVDVTSRQQFEDAFKQTKDKFGKIDIVVNNAGIGGESDDKWANVVDVNVKGTLLGTRLAMRYMSKKNGGNGGSIINMASMAGVNPNPFSPVYGCTKAGIIHATRCYAISTEAVTSGIRLNVVCPAFVDTPMFRNLAAADPDQTEGGDPAKVKAFIEHVGVMTVEEVADAMMKLLEDDTKNGIILRCAKNTGNVYSTINVVDV